MLSEIFLTFSVTSFIGCFLAIIKTLYKSKCKNFSFCGITVERDTVIEEKYDEFELQNQKKGQETKSVDNV